MCLVRQVVHTLKTSNLKMSSARMQRIASHDEFSNKQPRDDREEVSHIHSHNRQHAIETLVIDILLRP